MRSITFNLRSFRGGDKGTGFYMLLSCFIRHFRFPAFPPGFSQCAWHGPFSVDACCGQLGGLDLSEKTQIFQRSSGQARKCAKSFHGMLENQNKVSQMQTGSVSNEPESNIFRSFLVYSACSSEIAIIQKLRIPVFNLHVSLTACTEPFFQTGHSIVGLVFCFECDGIWWHRLFWHGTARRHFFCAFRAVLNFGICSCNKEWIAFRQLSNPDLYDSLDFGPSNTSSSRTLARPALTLQEDTSSGLGTTVEDRKRWKSASTCKRCKRETGLVRHGTNMHKTNTLRLKWNTKMLWQVFKSTQSTSSKAFFMLELSGRSFTMLHVSSKATFRPLIWFLLTFWFLMNSWHLFDDTLQLRHMNSSASISSACLALRILLLPISNLGSARTLARYGDAPGNSKRRDRSVCCLTSLSWLSILTNLEFHIYIKQDQTKANAYCIRTTCPSTLLSARTFRVTCARARKHLKQSDNTASQSESTERTPNTRQLL